MVEINANINLLKSSHNNTMTGSKFVRSLLNIMLRTENQTIYDLTRDLLENVVSYAIFSGVEYANHAQQKNHEINIWVDAIQKDTVDSFCRIFETAQKIHIQLETIKQSAKKYLVGHGAELEILISPLIAIAVLALSNEDTLSSEIVSYLCKIIAKLLLTSSNDVSLAVTIEYIFRDSKSRNVTNAELKSLLLYTQSIVKRNSIAESTSLCRSIFGDNHFHTIVNEMADYDRKYLKSKLVSLNRIVSDAPLVSVDVYRQCESLIKHSTSKKVKHQFYDILADNLPFSLQEMSKNEMWDENRKSLESLMRQLSFLISSCAHTTLFDEMCSVNEFVDIESIVCTLLKNDQIIITRKLSLVQACMVQFVPISVRPFWIESLIAIRQNGERDSQILATGMLCKSLSLYKGDELSQLTIEKLCIVWSELLLQTENNHLIPVESKLLRALEDILSRSMFIPSVHLSILNTILDLTPKQFTENINYDLDGIAMQIIQHDVTIIGERIAMDLLKDLNFSSSIPTRFALASNIVHEIATQRQTAMQSIDWYFPLLKFIVHGLTKIESLLVSKFT
jgi:CRISPR/Cas system CSM-associated protein Csm3 (group 7 of RAMP superfamily)